MWTKLIPGLLVVVAITALIVRSVDAADEVHEGKVIAVGTDSITVHDNRDDDNDMFVVTSETKITYNGKLAKLNEISAGDQAKVTATQRGDKLVAKEISAKSAQ
jgi:F420-0:gamma-glutamyl ligase